MKLLVKKIKVCLIICEMGNYIKKNLINGESIIYITSYHWIIFLSSKAFFTLFISSIIARYADEFAITSKRVIIKTGLVVGIH